MEVLLQSGKASVITEAPPRVIYAPEFISQTEHDQLLRQVVCVGIPRLSNEVSESPRTKWVQLSGRRLQNWGGLPHAKGMVQERMPSWLAVYAKQVTALGLFSGYEANHILVNEYKPGEGIMPHEDGPLFCPVIATINLGSHTVLDFYHKLQDKSSEVVDDVGTQHEDTTVESWGSTSTGNSSLEMRCFLSLLLEPRSLVVLEEDMYNRYLHGIQMQSQDVVCERIKNLPYCGRKMQIGDVLQRQTRVSLTIRHVLNVSKVKLKLGRY